MDKLTSNLKIENNNSIKNNKTKDNELLKGESAAVIAGAEIIKDNGYTVDKETLSNLKEYLSGDKSEISSKLSALKTAVEKEIPLKVNTLSKIQISNELSLLDFISDVNLSKLPTKKSTNNNDESHYNRELFSKLDRTEKMLSNIFKIVDKSINDSNFNQKTSPNISRELSDDSMESLKKDKTVNLSENRFDLSLEDKEDFLDKIKDDILSNFTNDDLIEDFNKSILELANYLNASESINANFGIKEILEIKVTQKLIDLKNDFSSLKSELTIDIYKINDETNNLSKEDKSAILYKSIEKLDTAIMKSEMSLYMDLKGERELIKISSNLQIAKKHLESGEIKQAESILKNAKSTLDSLKFEPSIKKAFALVNNTKLDESYNIKDMEKWLKSSAEHFTSSEKSVSTLIHYLRKMGLNNDTEQFQDMLQSKDESKTTEFKNFSNLKELLLKMNQQSNDTSKDAGKSNQILEHIEGNQLKNKIIDNKMSQSVELNIPINLSGRIKNVKVFIKSPQKMLQLDWENFDMYFVLNSDKMGEMGIKVSAVQRQLSVKIINDKAEKLASQNNLDDNFKTELEDFGYRLVKMVMEAWNSEEVVVNTQNDNLEGSRNFNSNNEQAKIDIKI